MTAIADNAPRFRVGTDHVESWFLRANDPATPRAIWLKATVLTKADGTTLSQAWFSVFDGDRTQAFCLEVPLAEAAFDSGPSGLDIKVGPLRCELTADKGVSAGELRSPSGRVSWDLTLDRLAGSLGAPLSLLPTARLINAPFPKNKLLTPFPAATFAGTVIWNDETWDLGSWIGTQGHNWGDAHGLEYAWGQCVFTDVADGAPFALMEGASGRIPFGGRPSPIMSMLVIRRGEDEFRFDRIIDLWRQRPDIDFPRWGLRMKGKDGEAHLEMTGNLSQMVCLAYQNPVRPTSYCLNSKTASVRLRVSPKNGNTFELRSAHGGALEFLMPDPVDDVQPIG